MATHDIRIRRSRRAPVLVTVAASVVLASLAAPSLAGTMAVSTAAQLQAAVNAANNAGGNTTILLADGTYTLSDTLYVNVPNVTIQSQSGVREHVIIEGDAMSASAKVGNVIRVAASNFTLAGVTLRKSGWHLIQVAGELGAQAPVIRNCILRDAYEQMLKVSNDPTLPAMHSDGGLVENCLFEYTAGIGPQYYIGGIDAHAAHGWTVRGNTFRSIISPSASVAEFAVHFWDGSADNTVEKNLIVNCDRGIGFGLDGQGNQRGVVRNNMVFRAASAAGPFADVGIALIDSPSSSAYNNTVVLEDGFGWTIEYRFSDTTGVLIANNLTNKQILNRDGASATLQTNVTNAADAWFVSVSTPDLHLASAVAAVVGRGTAVAGLVDDYDGDPRSSGAVDIGADQFGRTLTPNPPTNLIVR